MGVHESGLLRPTLHTTLAFTGLLAVSSLWFLSGNSLCVDACMKRMPRHRQAWRKEGAQAQVAGAAKQVARAGTRVVDADADADTYPVIPAADTRGGTPELSAAEPPLKMAQEGRKSANHSFVSYSTALAFARGLKLTSAKQWYEWCKSGQRPTNIPSAPCRTYKYEGWQGWVHWLRKPAGALAYAAHAIIEMASTSHFLSNQDHTHDHLSSDTQAEEEMQDVDIHQESAANALLSMFSFSSSGKTSPQVKTETEMRPALGTPEEEGSHSTLAGVAASTEPLVHLARAIGMQHTHTEHTGQTEHACDDEQEMAHHATMPADSTRQHGKGRRRASTASLPKPTPKAKLKGAPKQHHSRHSGNWESNAFHEMYVRLPLFAFRAVSEHPRTASCYVWLAAPSLVCTIRFNRTPIAHRCLHTAAHIFVCYCFAFPGLKQTVPLFIGCTPSSPPPYVAWYCRTKVQQKVYLARARLADEALSC